VLETETPRPLLSFLAPSSLSNHFLVYLLPSPLPSPLPLEISLAGRCHLFVCRTQERSRMVVVVVVDECAQHRSRRVRTTDGYYWRWVQHYRYSTAVLLDPICCTTQHGAAWRCARISAVESVKLMASLGRCNHAIAAESMKLVRKPARRTHACFRSRLGQRLGDDKARSMISTMTSDDVQSCTVLEWWLGRWG